MKKKIFISIFIVVAFFSLYLIYIKDDKDICLDTGMCSAGLEVNIEGEKIVINEETCKKHNGQWQNNSYCQF